MKNLTTFGNKSSQAMKPGFTTTKEIQDAIILGQVDFDHLMGFSRVYS
jgi:hypothetical protein